MGHNRAEVRRLSVLAAREAGARACNPGPVPARVSLAGARSPAGRLGGLGFAAGRDRAFGAAEGRAPGALRTEPVIVPYVL